MTGRIQSAETEILKLVFHFVDAESIGNRRVHFQCLASNAAPLVIWHCTQSAHVVYAIGQFDQYHSDVIDHRQQHFLKVCCLRFGSRLELKVGEFAQTVYDSRYIVTKRSGDLQYRYTSVFDYIVQ